MKSKATCALVLGLALALAMTVGAQERGARGGQPQAPATATTAPNIPGVVSSGTRVEPIKDGFMGTEGPIGLPDGSLIFTETNANRITKIDASGNTTTFLENTNGSNGLAWDSKGRLISVQTTPGNTKIGVIYPQSAVAVLADNFEGKKFGRPNDLAVNKSGGVYFTEPGPNAPPRGSAAAAPADPPLPPAVYYIAPGGKAVRIADGIERPNGIVLSPDEKTLYVNNTQGEYMLAFDVQPDGTVRNRRNFAKYEGVTRNEQTGAFNSGADGLAVDSQARIYAATNAGVQVFSPQGQHLGTIPVSRRPQNIAFAGPDKKTLYIVGSGAAYKVQLQSQGFRDRAK